jgi:hypothetical protein
MEVIMYKYLFFALIIFLLIGCEHNYNKNLAEYKTIAEEFFRGEYGCDTTVVDGLAADSIFVTYPIFQKIFGTTAIRGKEAVKNFSESFCERWKEVRININKTVAEGNDVVFVWSFSARNVGSPSPDVEPTNKVESWGGITLFRFNDKGKIIAEIGEESSPGPFARSITNDK